MRTFVLRRVLVCLLLCIPVQGVIAQDGGGNGGQAAGDDGGGGGGDGGNQLNPCPLQDMLPEIGCIGGGADGLVDLLDRLAPPAIDVFLALLILMLVAYAISLVMGSSDENAISEARKAFLFALIAAFIVYFREDIYDLVSIGGDRLVDVGALNPIFDAALTYMQIAAAGAAMAYVSIRAMQLMAAGGDEGRVATQRKLLINAVIGVGIVTLAGQIVRAALPGGQGILSQEAEGIALYILFIFGALITAAIVVGGAMLVLSYDEGMQERAKKSIFGAVIVLVMLICLGALMTIIM